MQQDVSERGSMRRTYFNDDLLHGRSSPRRRGRAPQRPRKPSSLGWWARSRTRTCRRSRYCPHVLAWLAMWPHLLFMQLHLEACWHMLMHSDASASHPLVPLVTRLRWHRGPWRQHGPWRRPSTWPKTLAFGECLLDAADRMRSRSCNIWTHSLHMLAHAVAFCSIAQHEVSIWRRSSGDACVWETSISWQTLLTTCSHIIWTSYCILRIRRELSYIRINLLGFVTCGSTSFSISQDFKGYILLWNWGGTMRPNFVVCSYSSCTQMLPVRDSIKMLRDAQWCDGWQMHYNSRNIACDGRIWNACKCRMHANLRTMHPLMHVFIMLLEWSWMMFHASWENSMGMHHPQPDVKCNASCNESSHSTMWMNVDGTHAI